jgi:hypothetical protein
MTSLKLKQSCISIKHYCLFKGGSHGCSPTTEAELDDASPGRDVMLKHIPAHFKVLSNRTLMVDRSENRLHVTTDQLKEQAKYQIILTCRSLEMCFLKITLVPLTKFHETLMQ